MVGIKFSEKYPSIRESTWADLSAYKHLTVDMVAILVLCHKKFVCDIGGCIYILVPQPSDEASVGISLVCDDTYYFCLNAFGTASLLLPSIL